MMRIGHGFDVHAFKPGNHIVLGGVQIAHMYSLEAHSDGDVLIHAICDAILGALAMGDIGKHFPDTDAQYNNIDSRILLRDIVKLMQAQGYQLGNLDSTIVAQVPKMAPHITHMREHLAADLNCQLEQVNVKATTTEQLGYLGRKEGIAAHAVVLLMKEAT